MTIIIFPSFSPVGKLPVPDEFKDLKGMELRTNRKLIRYIVEHSKYLVEPPKSWYELLHEHPTQIYKFDNYYIYYNEELECAAYLELTEVDTTRLWGIDEYDGAEEIVYYRRSDELPNLLEKER